MKSTIIISLIILLSFNYSCKQKDTSKDKELTAKEILGNSKYQALSFGGYRYNTRDSVPSVEDLKEDLRLIEALGVKLLRTYNTQHYDQAANLLQAIKELKETDSNFEMYVMLGAWIQCDGAWTDNKNHEKGDFENNKAEIDVAVALTNKYPDIVKIIAVGNEAMIHWAEGYYVSPKIILKWVNYLQEFKKSEKLPKDLWVTSSDNYEAWGGGSSIYKTKDLENLVKSVDFISLHTYPYHATNYQPLFWGIPENEEKLTDIEKIDAAMLRAKKFAIDQYQTTVDYVASLGIKKSIHIGETGWATTASKIYGDNGTHAANEYKSKLYYEHMRDWTNEAGLTCFYFKLTDESWKDSQDPLGSENHFGLINLNGEAKYALWNTVDQGIFKGLTRGGKEITKSFGGNKSKMMENVFLPPTLKEIGIIKINTVNKQRKIGDLVTENKYIVAHQTFIPTKENDMTYPSAALLFNPIDGTCRFNMLDDKIIQVKTGTGNWWACSLNINDEINGENLTKFNNGFLNFEIKGDTKSSFSIGFQTGRYNKKTLVTNAIEFNVNKKYELGNTWKKYTISIKALNENAELDNVTSVLSLKGLKDFDGKSIYLRNIYYSQN